MHLSESCDDDLPHIITHVETTFAVLQDVSATATIHKQLQQKQLLPVQHMVDTGYMSADHIVNAQAEYGFTPLGPVRLNSNWQTKVKEAYGFTRFTVDWDARHVTCPQGKRSVEWCERRDRQRRPVIQAYFAKKDCLACSTRARRTRSKTLPRNLHFPPRSQLEVLTEARTH